MTEERMNDVLATARGQAQRVAQFAAERSTPPLHGWHPRPSLWRRLAVGFAVLGFVIGSASWAWVRRDPHAVPAPVVAHAKVEAIAAAVAVAPKAAESALRAIKRKKVTRPAPDAVVPVAPDRSNLELEGPDDEVIYGKVPVKQAPLFTTEEYKARGVMVR